MSRSLKPSPSTSPADATDRPLMSSSFSPTNEASAALKAKVPLKAKGPIKTKAQPQAKEPLKAKAREPNAPKHI